MRFLVSATHPRRKKPYTRLVVGADSVADIPRALPGYEITDVRDRDDRPVPNWQAQLRGETEERKELPAATPETPAATSPRVPKNR